jgi:nitrate reductase NapAB chaperone NapD
MPIHSYLVYPKDGKKNELVRQFDLLPECETIVSTNDEMLVLVTDTLDEIQEAKLQNSLKVVPEIRSIALVYGEEC